MKRYDYFRDFKPIDIELKRCRKRSEKLEAQNQALKNFIRGLNDSLKSYTAELDGKDE